MQPSSRAKEYVEQVCGEVRWQKAHAIVQEELYAHMEDQREAYLSAGIAEEEADILAVEEMGNPLETGSHFDNLYRPHMEWGVLLFAGIIVAVGMVMRIQLLRETGAEIVWESEFLILAFGMAVMIYGYKLDYTALFQHYFSGKVSGVIWALLCTLAVYFVFFAGWHAVNGSMGWILVNGNDIIFHYLGLLWPVVMCAFLYMQYQKGASGYLYSFTFLLFTLCLFEGSSSAFFLLMGTGFFMHGYALWKNWFGCSRKWGLTFLLFPFVLIVMIIRYPYRLGRLYAVLHPFAGPVGYGYASVQIMTTLQEARIIGEGGKNLQYALEYIPNLMTDHILTAAVSHWGWVSLLPLFLAYGMLFYLGWRACYRVKSQAGKLLVVTVSDLWLLQIAGYLCNNFTTLQMGWYSLLFVQGRYSLLANLFLLGLVLSVFKTGAVQKDEWEQNRNFEEKQVFLKKPIRTKRGLEAFLKLEYNLEEPLFHDWNRKQEK